MEERSKLQLARTPEEIKALRDFWRRWRPQGTIGFHYNSNEPSYDKDQGSNYNPKGWGK